MLSIKRISFFLLLVLVLGGAFSFLRFFRNPEAFKDFLITQSENRLGSRLSFEDSAISIIPFPAIRMRAVRFEPAAGDYFSSLTAREAQFSFRLLPLLWGRLQVAGLQVKDGEGTFGSFPLTGINFKVRGLGTKKARFEGKASGLGDKEVFQGKGEFGLLDWRENIWNNLSLNGDITVSGWDLSRIVDRSSSNLFPKLFMSGGTEGRLHLQKEKGRGDIKGTVAFAINDFHFEKAPPFSLTGQAEFLWNWEGNSVEFKKVAPQTPFGEWEGRGVLNVETGEIGEVRLTGRKVVLEKLIRYFPSFQSALPLDTGFSGESELDLTVQGTWDYLSLHVNWDLTPTVLTYAEIFSKPKDFPMGVNADLILNAGSVLSGDLSVRIGAVTAKGAVTNLDLKTGAGELTILTNKFNLNEWKTLLSPFSNYQLSGATKILLSWKGNLTQLDKAERMLNLTLSDVTLLSPSGRGIRGANILLDLSSLNLRIKDSSFKVSGFPIHIETEIFSLGERPQGKIQFRSPQLDLFSLFENLEPFHPLFLSGKGRDSWKEFREGLQDYLPKPFALENFSLNLLVQEGKFVLENLTFQSLDGQWGFGGEWEGGFGKPIFRIEADLDRVSLARYFEGRGRADGMISGNLFFKGKFRGEGIKPEDISNYLSGQGTISITNGEWESLKLMNSLIALEPLASLASYRSETTPFLDLKASWDYSHGKFGTRDFLLYSDHLWVEGEGNLSLEGNLNSRLQIFLSKPLTELVLTSWGAGGKAEGKQLGPFPFLLVGGLTRAEAKPDERLISPFLLSIQNRRFREILHAPFNE